MAVSIDASSPATVTVTNTAGTTLTTASFTPPAGTLLVACGGEGYNGTTSDATFAISDSLSGTWQTDAKEQPASGGLPQAIIASRWNSTSSAMTVTLTMGTHQKGAQLTIFVLNGTATSSWVGGTAISTTTLDGSVTTTKVGSLVVVQAGNDTLITTPTVDGHTTQVNDLHDTTESVEILVGRSTSTTSSPGATTFGWTNAGTSPSWAAAEYVPLVNPSVTPRVVLQAVRRAAFF